MFHLFKFHQGEFVLNAMNIGWVGRSVGQSVGQAVGRSGGCSVARSGGRSVGRSVGWSIPGSLLPRAICHDMQHSVR